MPINVFIKTRAQILREFTVVIYVLIMKVSKHYIDVRILSQKP